MRPVSIRFRRSPKHYSHQDSLLARVVAAATPRPVVIESSRRAFVDLEFSSVHPSHRDRIADFANGYAATRGSGLSWRARRRLAALDDAPTRFSAASVWFTGENVRPPESEWDCFLSFDTDPMGGRNFYFPHWWEYVSLLGSSTHHFLGRPMVVDELMRFRSVRTDSRPGFACAFIGNPTAPRMRAVNELSKVGDVQVFGAAVGKPVPSMAQVASQFKFVLCFENDLYPGYVTEKPFQAWAAGTVPLWWGLDPARYVNPEAVINLAALSGMDEFVDRVASLDSAPEAWEAMASQPILVRYPDLDPIVSVVASLID